MYKPLKACFDAFAAGRLLLLAPWQRHTEQRPLTREQRQPLNTFAEQITQEDNAL